MEFHLQKKTASARMGAHLPFDEKKNLLYFIFSPCVTETGISSIEIQNFLYSEVTKKTGDNLTIGRPTFVSL